MSTTNWSVTRAVNSGEQQIWHNYKLQRTKCCFISWKSSNYTKHAYVQTNL